MSTPGQSDVEPRTAAPPRPEGEVEAIRRTWLLTLFAAMMIGFSVAPILNDYRDRLNKDYVLWYYTGRAVAQGAEIYPKDGRIFPFMYPPSAAAILAVASGAGEAAFVRLLVAAQTAAWAACVLLSVGLATGRATRGRPLLYLVPSLGVVAYIHDMYLLGQPNLVLLACMLGAFACLRGRRPACAGALVAVAAAIKAFPFLAIGYLIYRRAWKATLAMVATLTLALIVLPMPFRGASGAYEDLGTWTQGMLLRYDSGSIAQRPERGFGFKNQSLMALANRLLRDIPADGEARDGWKVNLARLDFATVNRIIAALALLLGGSYVALMPWKAPRAGPPAAIEGAMLLLLILMFSPLSFNYAFVWLLYPLTVALHLGLAAPAGSAGRRVLVGSVAGSLASLGLSIVSARTAAGYGNSFVAAAILLVALGWRLAVEPGLDSPAQVGARLAARAWARARRRGRDSIPPVYPSLPAPHGSKASRQIPIDPPRPR